MTAREHTNHGIRIAASVVIALLYTPLLVWVVVGAFGAVELQRLFDWLTFRCGECSARSEILVLIFAGVFVATLPGLMFGLYMWVSRARRSDRQVVEARHYFKTAPERVPPATVGVDPVERRFYRDRQGRLRPMEGPE